MLRKLRLKQKNGFLIKKTCNYTEQDSSKDRVDLVKTNRVSKYTLSVQKLCYSRDKFKCSSKKYYSFIILVMPPKNESINLKLPKFIEDKE